MKKISKWLLRDDLNLRGHWWHRLFLVVFFISFAYSLLLVWNTPLPKYRAIDTLRNRMTEELKLLPDLISSDEKLGSYENNLHSYLYYENEGWILRQPNIYCSKNIIPYIEALSEKIGVSLFKGNGVDELISIESFKKYIGSQNSNCVYVTELANKSSVIAYPWFVDESFKVWKESTLASMIYILKESFLVALGFLLILIIYYKIFIYIFFGSKKHKENS